MDHRRLQRTLFRMQLDPQFAEAICRGDGAACTSTGLEEGDLAVLRRADAAGITADKDGRRRLQVAGNVAAEFMLSVCIGPAAGEGERWVARFLGSPEFHRAVVADRSFALAFAQYAERIAQESASELFKALVKLEAAMAEVRRQTRLPPSLSPGDVALGPNVRIVRLPEGCLDHAVQIRAALDARSAPPPTRARLGKQLESVLVAAAATTAERTREVRVELLSPIVADFLERASSPLSLEQRAAFARECRATPAELEEMVNEFVKDRVLVRGGDPT